MRRACGTRMGIFMHLDADEGLCGLCGLTEAALVRDNAASALEVERLRPTPPIPPPWVEIKPIGTEALRALMDEIFRDDRGARHLRAVS